MKNLLFLYHYKNYYDRKIKHFSTLEEYFDLDGIVKQGINFTPADGISTSITLNWTEEWNPDYIVVFDELNSIVSRWYILESVRTLNGQYRVNMRRDIIADYFQELVTAPMYILKGNLKRDNSLIYNSEGLSFNQIKTSETLLKDETGTPWIVGYTTKTQPPAHNRIAITPNVDGQKDLDSLGLTFENNQDPTLGAKLYQVEDSIEIELRFEYQNQIGIFPSSTRWNPTVKYFRGSGNFVSNQRRGDAYANYAILSNRIVLNDTMPFEVPLMSDFWRGKLTNYKNQLLNGLDTHFNGMNRPLVTQTEYQEFLDSNGKIFWSEGRQKYYKVTFSAPAKSHKTVQINHDESYNTDLLAVLDTARNEVKDEIQPFDENHIYSTSDKNNRYALLYTLMTYEVNIVEVIGEEEIGVTITKTHATTSDAPYNIICARYTETNFALMQKLITTYGVNVPDSGVIYDVQILPYCPIRRMMTENGIDRTGWTKDVDYHEITKTIGGEVVDYMYWATKSSDHFIINSPINIPDDATELKVEHECSFHRLNSPNYASSFDFNAVKNNGVDYFHVYFTYKPFTPYIQVSPNFKGLYGSDFSDARGLILSGDFSVAMSSNAWTQYENQNKNYQNIFNTQISTMDKNRKLEMISQGISSATSAVGIGAGAGLMTGNPLIGLGAGAISAGAGAADMAIGQSIYQNNKQSQKDIFKYSLGNIQARPDSLTKVSAYTIVNKYFPFVEYYTATDVEKEMMRNKLKYEGMTVMAIGTMSDFIDESKEFNFFKGQLIQNGNISDDYHLIDAIAVELEKGVYL